jgi:uncharacterized protein YodC (DUF2158 family)
MSEVREFKPGDVVRLISGGPLMTVVTIGPEPAVRCLWYSEGYSDTGSSFVSCYVDRTFPADVLERAPRPGFGRIPEPEGRRPVAGGESRLGAG